MVATVLARVVVVASHPRRSRARALRVRLDDHALDPRARVLHVAAVLLALHLRSLVGDDSLPVLGPSKSPRSGTTVSR